MPDAYDPDKRRTLAHIAYALCMFPTLLTTIVGVTIAYVVRAPWGAHWLDSHFRVQIHAFWSAIMCGAALWGLSCVYLLLRLFMHTFFRQEGWAIGGLSWEAALVAAAFAGIVLHYYWRIVRGWIALARRKEA